MTKTEEKPAILKDINGEDVALKGVKIRGRLHGLLAEVEVEQTYVNLQDVNIEAVYTFPLPLGSTLLALEVEIAGQKLAGSIVEKKQAERQYEDAITDGDSAVMLEEAAPGLYTASLGNLMASETAVIRYRYALLLSWHGDRLRFLLPTTIAPRYGNPDAAGLQPHQVPDASLSVDYPLELSILVEGELASATIASPSHPISVQQSASGMVVQLSGKACLDRDFILTIQSGMAQQSSCVLTQDRENQVALASLRIPPMPDAEEQPLALKLVIDCSGSMAGTSIAQARKAALEILNQLRPRDSFNVTLFGTDCLHIFPELVMANAENITQAGYRLEILDANMGGTEMEKALDAVFSLGNSEGSATVLLITDGEIHEHEKFVQRAKQSGHRVFTVGVGNAVAETFLRTLANVTGGACELIAPQEGMSERVLFQFHRMRQPKLGELRIEWPSTPEWQTPLPVKVFAGDTVQVFAGFLQPVEGNVKLVIQGTDSVVSPIVPVNETEIPRIAAAYRMALSTKKDGLQLALDYQLLSRWTNFLVVAERTDKVNDLPVLHKVPQMLAAGWGGIGNDVGTRHRTGRRDRDESILQSVRYSELCAPAVMRGAGSHKGAIDKSSEVGMFRIPSFLRKQEEKALAGTSSPANFMKNFESIYFVMQLQRKLPGTISELERVGLDRDTVHFLLGFVAQGVNEDVVVLAFVHALSQSAIGERFSRSFKRVILKQWKQVVNNADIDVEMQAALALVTEKSWNWQSTLVAE